jgi:hypothetical protein
VRAQPVFEFRPTAARAAAVASTAVYTNASVVSISDSPAFSRRLQEESQSADADGLGCARGLQAALVLEAGIGLLAYGVWHFIHLIR